MQKLWFNLWKSVVIVLAVAAATLFFSYLPAQATRGPSSEFGPEHSAAITQEPPFGSNRLAHTPLLSNWSAPVQVNAGNPDATAEPAAAIQGNTAYAVWADNRTGNDNLFLAQSLDGGQSWTTLSQVSPDRLARSPVLAMDDQDKLYLAWQRAGGFLDAKVAASSDGGQNWSQPVEVTDFVGEASSPDWDMAVMGNGVVYVVGNEYGDVILYQNGDVGNPNSSWSQQPVVSSGVFTIASSLAVESNNIYVAWEVSSEDILVSQSADGGNTWSAPVTVAGGDRPDITAAGNGQVVIGWEFAGFLYVSESNDGGNTWSVETALGFLSQDDFVLAADPAAATGAVVAAWDAGNQILASTGTIQTTGDCPLVELISVRHLSNTTLGVVGFVDLNQVTSATLSLDGATPVDLLLLTQHNASGGGNDPGGEGRLRGLWSATLISPSGFTSGMMVVADATSASQNCQETLDVIMPSPGWHVEIETIDPVVGSDPAVDGLDQIAVHLDSGDGSLPTLGLSRYLYDPNQPGLEGLWQTMATFTAQAEGNAFKNIVADLVDPGENLYRVTVDGQLQVEDVDGFFAVPVSENLATAEDYQRRQALSFRDAVRKALFDPIYAENFSEQLLVAMGAQESGKFDNALVNGNGIMQVTCGSGRKGATELGVKTSCDDNPPPPNYEATTESIDFNTKDALLVLAEAYDLAANEKTSDFERGCDAIFAGGGEKDILITTVVYYNAWCNFLDQYMVPPKSDEAGYLGAIANQLQHNPNGGNSLPPVGNNLSIAEFLTDADYTPEITTLLTRLQNGNTQICATPGINCN